MASFYKVVYFDEVKLDVKEAKDWYRRQVPGLEERFAQDIKAAILRLKDRPAIHAIRYKNTRIAHPMYFLMLFTFILMNKPKLLL